MFNDIIKLVERNDREAIMKLHGAKITCIIDDVDINYARLSVDEEPPGFFTFYICQDLMNGSSCIQKFEYKYSWIINGVDDFKNAVDFYCIKFIDEGKNNFKYRFKKIKARRKT